MTTQEAIDFIDCVSHDDCYIRFKGKVYLCDGPARYGHDAMFHVFVMEIKPDTGEGMRDMLSYASDSRDDCMKHFIEDKCWDGKSFWEVAPDMEWIDL